MYVWRAIYCVLWDNCFGTSTKYAALVDNDTFFSLSVAHTALCYSPEHQKSITTNRSTRKEIVMMHWVFERFLQDILCY